MGSGGARLIILLLADLYLLKGRQQSQNGAANSQRVLALRGHNVLHHAGSQGSHLLHSVGNAWIHVGPTRQPHVGIEVLMVVNITFC